MGCKMHHLVRSAENSVRSRVRDPGDSGKKGSKKRRRVGIPIGTKSEEKENAPNGDREKIITQMRKYWGETWVKQQSRKVTRITLRKNTRRKVSNFQRSMVGKENKNMYGAGLKRTIGRKASEEPRRHGQASSSREKAGNENENEISQEEVNKGRKHV